MAFVTQNRVILYVQPDGPGSPFKPLSINDDVAGHGMADKTHPGPGREVVFGTDVFGRFVSKIEPQTAPGGLNTSTIEDDDIGTISFLHKKFEQNGCYPVQERWIKCGRLDVATSWDRLRHRGQLTITQKTEGAGPSREANGANMFDSYEVSWPYTITLLKHALTALTTGEDQDLNDIAVLSDLIVGCEDCFPGYTPDKILYIGGQANSGSPGDFANLWVSTDGGSTFSVTSTNPFAVLEDIQEIEVGFITDTQFRVIVANDDNDIVYSDFTLGAETTSSWSSGITVGTDIEDMKWLFFDRLYVAADGDIYVSEDQGDSVGSALFTGSNAINDIAKGKGGQVWAVGASNTILRERNQSGTFESLTGPTGGGDFTAIFQANDGRLYAGNGQSIYVSTNEALNVGGWTALKDFGANHVVEKINCPGGIKAKGGDSQLIRVVVDDTAGTGEVWESEDGGNSWRQIDELGSDGYNEAYFSPIDDNLAFIVGDSGILHKFAAKNA